MSKLNIRIIHGENPKALNEFSDNHFDSIVTDPPYGYKFMGKKWDYKIPSVEIWKECLRVLKPGGHLLSFAGTRTQHRMTCNIEDAGFEIRDCLMWVYGSGFPKSLNISKQFDLMAKKNKEGEKLKILCGEWLKDKRISLQMSLKDVAKYFPSVTDNITGCVSNWELGKLPTWNHFSKLKQILKLDNSFDYLINKRPKEWIKATREVIGQKRSGIGSGDTYAFLDKNYEADNKVDITIPSTDLAKEWDGWGTGLKPAYEPIILARKSLSERTIALNVLKWGTGGINIDECRIKLQNEKPPSGSAKRVFANNDYMENKKYGDNKVTPIKGRFPANFIHDGSQEVLELFPETLGAGNKIGSKKKAGSFFGDSESQINIKYDNSGSAARYFYCAKASKQDRDEGLEDLEKKQVNDGRKNQSSIDNPQQRGKTYRGNFHPTVKPSKLMQYLVKLITPKNGILLDPFCGSGSTGKACVKEGFNFVGIDKDKEYCEISEKRIDFVLKEENSKMKINPLSDDLFG